MFNWKNFLLLMLVAGFIAACNSSKNISVPVEPQSSSGKGVADNNVVDKRSVVYVYRPAKVANIMLTPDINIAGVSTIAMANGMYKKVYLPPGIYAVRLQPIEGSTEAFEYDLEVDKGKVHYLRVDALISLNAGQQGYQPYQRRFELVDVPARQAIKEIADCKDLDTVEKKKSAINSGRENADNGGFSVDKTQNPFSH
ncbi:MAG: DUF2846 domain-containing protein [Gammaproteobacteria bacterium]|nr:DUF2846 domain-containing protein [Gammaproteobacteria bacterium]